MKSLFSQFDIEDLNVISAALSFDQERMHKLTENTQSGITKRRRIEILSRYKSLFNDCDIEIAKRNA